MISVQHLTSTSYLSKKTKQKQTYQQQQKLKQNNKHLPTTEDQKMKTKKEKQTNKAVNTFDMAVSRPCAHRNTI